MNDSGPKRLGAAACCIFLPLIKCQQFPSSSIGAAIKHVIAVISFQPCVFFLMPAVSTDISSKCFSVLYFKAGPA